MPILLFLLALFLPRVTLFLIWLFSRDYLDRAFETVLWPVLGFIFLPLTTLAWAFAMNSHGSIEGLWLILIGVAALIDLMGFGWFRRRRS